MLTVFLFLAVVAVVGTIGYLAMRPLILERWGRWQTERRETGERQWREHHRQMLQDQATARVLEQITQQEEQARQAKRRRQAA